MGNIPGTCNKMTNLDNLRFGFILSFVLWYTLWNISGTCNKMMNLDKIWFLILVWVLCFAIIDLKIIFLFINGKHPENNIMNMSQICRYFDLSSVFQCTNKVKILEDCNVITMNPKTSKKLSLFCEDCALFNLHWEYVKLSWYLVLSIFLLFFLLVIPSHSS